MSKDEILDRAARKAIIDHRVKTAGVTTIFSGSAREAGRFGGLDNALKVVGVLGAAILVNQFVKKLIEYGESKRLQMLKPSYYKKMIEKNPRLLKENPEEVMDLWNTLYHNSPHLAQDPVAAGAFITQNINARYMEDMGGPPMDTYSTLNKIQSDIQGNREAKDPGLTGLIAGSTLFM